MGTWGVGLYAGDDALDLRSSISAVCHLPYGGDQLVELLAELNPEASDPAKEGHSTFWLVVADQLHRRGIRSVARGRALDIIVSGADLEMLAKLGMTDADLRKRRRMLDELATELRSEPPAKPRKTLKKPQPLLFGAGDVLAFRIDRRGNCYNPYQTDPVLANFKPVGWDGTVIVGSGHALEYLAWYAVAPTSVPFKDRPTLEQVMARIQLAKAKVGTLSKSHVARIGLERLGTAVTPKLVPPSRKYLVSVTAQGICASNHLSRWGDPAKPVELK
jgi:hypothetical protein